MTSSMTSSKLAEARRVVVADGLGVAEGLEDRVGREVVLLHPSGGGGHRGEVLQAC